MRLTFAGCVFDSGTRQITGHQGEVLSISPKAFQLLETLIVARPRAVSKEELHRLLWPETFVTDANLPNLIAELRSRLGDDAKDPHIIRTVQRFGYAFVAAESAPAAGVARVYRLIWGDRELALRPGENLFGRDEDAVAWINDSAVSRRHARIIIDDSGAVLEDLGSKNGTYLRGERIASPKRLSDGDLLTIGEVSMVFRSFSRTASTASAIEK